MYFKVELSIIEQDYIYKAVYTIYQEDYCRLQNATEVNAKEFILNNIRDNDVVDYVDRFNYEKQLLSGAKLKEICRTWNT